MLDGEGSQQDYRITVIAVSVWISLAAVAALLFIFVLGRGITWSR